MNYIAIGDIHGCLRQLEEILFLSKKFSDHKLIFLGDYIDRGTKSNEVLDLVKDLDAICLVGNHESMLMENVKTYSQVKPEFIDDYLARKKISRDNYEWLMTSLLTHYETENYFFSHAGLNPNKPLVEQNELDLIWTYYEGSYIHLTEKLVIQGHVRGEKVRLIENHYLIDTGCGLGGYLSAIVLPERIILQSKTKSSNYQLIKYF